MNNYKAIEQVDNSEISINYYWLCVGGEQELALSWQTTILQ
jgi:hypothetical protein